MTDIKRRDLFKTLAGFGVAAAIRVSDLKPDDVIIFKTKEKLPEAAIAQIKGIGKEIFPNNKVLVLCDGVEIEVYKHG